MSTEIALDIAHENLQLLVFDTVHKFRARYGGVFKELLADAELCFMHAVKSYDANEARLTTWVRNTIWFGLLDRVRKEQHRQRICRMSTIVDSEGRHLDFAKPKRFCPEMLLLEVSQDASFVANLAIESHFSAFTPNHKRNVIMQNLLDLGWCGLRILEAFKEINQSLKH